jgi:hypothetical protein
MVYLRRIFFRILILYYPENAGAQLRRWTCGTEEKLFILKANKNE